MLGVAENSSLEGGRGAVIWRYYDPNTGRYLTPDPLGLGGGDPTLFTYARSNPVRFSDPAGLYTSIATTVVEVNDRNREIVPPGADALTDPRYRLALTRGCHKNADGKWGFDHALTLQIVTAYASARTSKTKPGFPGATLGEHEGLHVGDFLYDFAPGKFNEGVPSEGFASKCECEAEQRDFASRVSFYFDTTTLFSSCRDPGNCGL